MKQRLKKGAAVRLSVCMSLDGFISRADGSAPNQEKFGGWTSAEDKAEFWKEVDKSDLIMIGRNTLNEMPKLKKPITLLTRHMSVPLMAKAQHNVETKINPDHGTVRWYLDTMKGKKILLCGGATVYDFMLRWNFVDQLVITLEPILLKEGVKFARQPGFNGGQKENKFVLVSSRAINPRGTLRLEYRRTNEWTQ